MKTSFLMLVVSVLAEVPALAALKVAEKAPDFSARASLAGKEFNFSLQDALKKMGTRRQHDAEPEAEEVKKKPVRRLRKTKTKAEAAL